MKEDKLSAKNSTSKENDALVENGKKKTKEERPATKIVVRRLPPSMTEEQFKMQVSPLPDIDYFYFVPADLSLTPNAFSRAYINFVDQSDLFIFTQKFDGYVFVDSKGGEFPAVVEFAPFQRIPKNRPNRRKDPRMGTIETDPLFILFKERLETESLENRTAASASKQHFFETALLPEKKEIMNTPLLEYLKNRRAERQRIRDEKREEKRKKDLERRKAKEEQRRTKKDDDTSVVKVLNNQNSSKERMKEKDVKQSYIKKKSDDVKTTVKERSSVESRLKESKTRTGKSYSEERQRHAERREEQRKKLSLNQNTGSNTETKSPPSATEENDSVNDDKATEEKCVGSESNKGKDNEYKKPERAFKREEIRKSSYNKYDSKRDKENDETRKPRRINERSHQSSRRDDEKSEDSGRKRYSESRRSHDSVLRDKYKDKEKIKSYSQKKSHISTTDLNKSKDFTESSTKTHVDNDVLSESLPKTEPELKEGSELSVTDEKNEANSVIFYKESKTKEKKTSVDVAANQKTFESKEKTKLIRRKSLECDRNRFSSTFVSNKTYSREKFCERKRRNSVGSNKQNLESIDLRIEHTEKDCVTGTEHLLVAKSNDTISKVEKETTELDSKSGGSVVKLPTVDQEDKEYESMDFPKRRNSTGEVPEKMSPRRNSLGSEDKNQVGYFKEHKFDDRKAISEAGKSKDGKKIQPNNCDPKTEARIRNKNRPSIELYRPGMGKYSRQRMEREKGLGSSTEVDSPSSSPSPTPVLKHKSVALH